MEYQQQRKEQPMEYQQQCKSQVCYLAEEVHRPTKERDDQTKRNAFPLFPPNIQVLQVVV